MKVIPFFIIFVETIDIMKNIHLLQTDQPTGIFETNSGLQFSIMNKVRYGEFKGFHIYLTSNEEIKEGDWFLSDFNSFPLHNIKEFSERKDSLGWKQEDLKNNLKIILTTDPTLILNGVQAIDDEFLEWFMAHPSCEYVTTYDGLFGEPRIWKKYIILPQEEPKHETLEDAAERNHNEQRLNTYTPYSFYDAFKDGAKWMEKRTYSEDEVRELLMKALTHTDYNLCGALVTAQQEIRTANFNVWFEEYKKK